MAKGWTVVRMIMILDVDVTAERRHYNTHRPLKGKRLTTFCASLALLQNVFAVHRRAIPQPSARRAVKLKNPPANGRSILRTLTPRACPKKQCSPKKGSTVFLPAFMTISPASGQRSLFPFLLRPVLRTRRRRGSRTRCAIRRRWHRRCRRQR